MHDNIESHLVEKRVFKPPPGFSSKSRIKSLAQYRRMYRESIQQPAKFWTREAKELVWHTPWKKVLEWKPPFAKWFVGGKLNVSENCLDRHLAGSRRNKAAIIWEGEPGDKRTLTYQQLHREVCRFANVLKRNKIKKGDRLIIYLPNIPEAAIAMPSDFDDFTPAAMWRYTGRSFEVLGHVRLLQWAMHRAGFWGMRTEWWHFTIADWQKYLPEEARQSAHVQGTQWSGKL